MGLFSGLSNVGRALALLRAHPRLIPWALAPAVVTFLLSLLGVWMAVTYGDDVVESLWKDPGNGWLHWVWWAVTGLARITSALLAVFVTPWLVVLLGLPLCEPMASRADAILGGSEIQVSLLTGITNAVRTAALVTAIGVTGTVALLVLGLIPGVGLLTGPFAILVWTPMFLCFDLQDSSLSRRNISLRRKVGLVLRHPLRSIGIGLVATGLLAIPVVNLLGLPIAVLGGVLAVRDLEEKGSLPSSGTAKVT